jgi:hypothetical protein
VTSLGELWTRARWVLAWELGRSLWFNSRERVDRNLTAVDRQDFAAIVRKRPGRPWNLSDEKGRRLTRLVKQAATGRRDPGWNSVGLSIVTLLIPRVIVSVWERRPVGRSAYSARS